MVEMNAAANKQETLWWAKFFVFSSVLSIVILISGPFGYKYGVTGLAPSLISVLVALVGAFLVILSGIVMTIVATKKGLPRERNMIVIAMVMSLIPIIFVLPQMIKARSVPPIHDISTDTVNPPEFYVLVAARESASNDLVYAHEGSAETLAYLQKQAYPAVVTATSDLSIAEVVAKSAEILSEQGLEVVNMDPASGIVEATATTFWFGFKDDVVVRASKDGSSTKIDVRSVSRVGQSDIGANAARIQKFITAITST
ncbi:MAG: hypothetical protein ACJAYE_000801 [Candidatus Azotimanducaceae bacterium]|jgi:hypothetical protein